MSLLREYIYDNNVRKLGSAFNFVMDATKPPESQTPLLEGDAAEGSNCSHSLHGKEIKINAMDGSFRGSLTVEHLQTMSS